MSDDPSLFAQLKKRHVFRVAAMYLVGAWVLLQFGEIMIDRTDAVPSAGRTEIGAAPVTGRVIEAASSDGSEEFSAALVTKE